MTQKEVATWQLSDKMMTPYNKLIFKIFIQDQLSLATNQTRVYLLVTNLNHLLHVNLYAPPPAANYIQTWLGKCWFKNCLQDCTLLTKQPHVKSTLFCLSLSFFLHFHNCCISNLNIIIQEVKLLCMKWRRVVEIHLQQFLIAALDTGECLASRASYFTHGIHSTAVWASLTAIPNALYITILPLLGSEPRFSKLRAHGVVTIMNSSHTC